MASLFNSVKNWFREKKDQAAEAVANPERDGKYAIEDAKKQESDFRRQVAGVVADIKQLERDIKNKQDERKKYDKLARQFATAVKGGDESQRSNLDAAAERVETLEAEVKQLQESLKSLQASRTNLQAQLDNVRNRIAKAERGYKVQSARIKAARIKKSLNESRARIANGVTGLEALDNLSNAADRMEAEADAAEELGGGSDNLDDLEAAAAAIGGSSASDRYL